MKKFVLSGLLLILFSTTLVAAQDAQPSPSTPAEPSATTAQTASGLTNKDVIDLLKAGISPEIVIAKIRTSTTAFDTSSVCLQELKASNVPDSVILAMLQPHA
ncbi:MAG: hypothetical protein ABR557_14925, partial [Pyrinomonadaceae bacterium]